MNTAMKSALENAGYKLASNEFYVACVDALRRSGLSPVRAQNDGRLRDMLVRYLTSIAADMKHPQIGGSRGQTSIDTQHTGAPVPAVPNTEIGGGGGQIPTDTLRPHAPAVAELNGRGGGHVRRDDHQQSAPASSHPKAGEGAKSSLAPIETVPQPRPPAREPTAIQRQAVMEARKQVVNSIFDRTIGDVTHRVGSVTRFDLRQDKRKAMLHGYIRDRLLAEIEWPNDQTPLEQCATKQQVEEIFSSAYTVLDQQGITNVGA